MMQGSLQPFSHYTQEGLQYLYYTCNFSFEKLPSKLCRVMPVPVLRSLQQHGILIMLPNTIA